MAVAVTEAPAVADILTPATVMEILSPDALLATVATIALGAEELPVVAVATVTCV